MHIDQNPYKLQPCRPDLPNYSHKHLKELVVIMANEKLDYMGYLAIDQIISAQHLISEKHGKPAHIEMMYIVVHQAYELWFKEIIHELDSVITMFDKDFVNEENMGVAVARLRRIVAIQKVLLEHLNVLETMTPLEFLDFRKFLGTASGFQSYQYRLIENKLGLLRHNRLKYIGNKDYIDEFDGSRKETLEEAEASPTLLNVVAKWLERTPFLNFRNFSFVESYRAAVEKMLAAEEQVIRSDQTLRSDAQTQQLDIVASTRESYCNLLDPSSHEKALKAGLKSLSYQATIAALFINLYRNEPILQLPFQLLETLVDIDENFTNWRSRHAVLVHRMLGRKMGTGQSSGYDYLKRTVEKYRIFTDFFDLATYLIPRSELPELPPDLKKDLGFYYTVRTKKD